MEKWGLYQRSNDEHIHRAVSWKAGVTDLLGETQPPIDLHSTGIASFHLGQELRRLLLLDQHTAHPLFPKIDC